MSTQWNPAIPEPGPAPRTGGAVTVMRAIGGLAILATVGPWLARLGLPGVAVAAVLAAGAVTALRGAGERGRTLVGAVCLAAFWLSLAAAVMALLLLGLLVALLSLGGSHGMSF